MPQPSKGVRLAIDVGSVRIGVARCDADQIMALPLATLANDELTIERIIGLATDYSAQLIYVGKPVSLNENETASTFLANDFAIELSSLTEIPVHLLDERLTTVSAKNVIKETGKTEKKSRNYVDQVAAVILLEQAIAIEKSTGRLAGTLVTKRSGEN